MTNRSPISQDILDTTKACVVQAERDIVSRLNIYS